MVPGNVDEGAGVEEEQEEELPNMLNGMSEGPHYRTYSTQGSEPVPPSLPSGVLVGQPIVLTLSKHAVVISDSQRMESYQGPELYLLY